MKIRWMTAVLFLGMVLCVSGCRGDSSASEKYEKVKLVMTVNGTEEAVDTKVARHFAELMKEETDGRVQVHVVAMDQLAGGAATRGFEMLANGSVDLAGYASGTVSVLDDRLSVGMLPWLFKDYREARQVIDETGGAYYEKLLAQHGITYIGSIHNGFRQLTNNQHPVRTPEDMKGLRIRVPAGELHVRLLEAFGADPVSMSWNEVPAGLENGVIDGQDNGFGITASAHLNELQSYMTVWNYMYENFLFMANSKTFESLEPGTQALIRVKLRESCEWGRDLLEGNEQKIREQFLAEGIEITELSEDELQPFREMAQPIVKEMKLKYGEEACNAFRVP